MEEVKKNKNNTRSPGSWLAGKLQLQKRSGEGRKEGEQEEERANIGSEGGLLLMKAETS